MLWAAAVCVAGPWGPALDIREKEAARGLGGNGKHREQEEHTKAERWLRTNEVPALPRHVVSGHSQAGGPGSGWVLQARVGAGWLSDSAKP